MYSLRTDTKFTDINNNENMKLISWFYMEEFMYEGIFSFHVTECIRVKNACFIIVNHAFFQYFLHIAIIVY